MGFHIFSPEVFQGSLRQTRYFEGWYLKQVSVDRSAVYSFIPGVSLTPTGSHAFIQIINGITAETHYIQFPMSQFSASKRQFDVTIGKNHFSKNSVSLDIQTDEISIRGELTYQDTVPFPHSIFAPGIMGPFTYIPNMECNHGMVSANHKVKGSLLVNGETINFNDGAGYIEKDWGRSFPESWIWIQCNSFELKDTSFMLSIAKIPSFGFSFTGFLGFFYHEGKFETFATWNGSKIITEEKNEKGIKIEIRKGDLVYEVIAIQKMSGILKAPKSGEMERHIKESVDSDLKVRVMRRGEELAKVNGTHAGLEIVGR